MPDQNGNLYLFEAVELRSAYDRHIKLLESLITESEPEPDSMFRRSREEEKEPADDFDLKEMEEELKKLQTKRVKLNQAIQAANFDNKIDFRDNEISIAEALELRKNILSDIDAIRQRVLKSAYKRIIHKEKRDIVHAPRVAFEKTYEEYKRKLNLLRQLVTKIHSENHKNTVIFKDDKS